MRQSIRTGQRYIAELCGVCLLITATATGVSAQSADSERDQHGRFSGYAFAAPLIRFGSFCQDLDCRQPSWIRQEAIPHVGIGVEWRPLRSVGMGTEIGLVVSNGYPAGILSINGTYYVPTTPSGRRSLAPFATGGYSLGPFGHGHGFNLGGGVTYGRGRGPGVRLEARSSFWRYDRALEFRLGVTFGGS